MNIKITKEMIEGVIKECYSYRDLLRKLNRKPTGGSISNIRRRCEAFDIDTTHLKGKKWARGRPSKKRLIASDILVLKKMEDGRQNHKLLKRALLESGVEYKCFICGIFEWLGKPLGLEIDHINGLYWDHQKHNLRFLCPHCHSQTVNYGNKKRH
jgi:hypothetical protein